VEESPQTPPESDQEYLDSEPIQAVSEPSKKKSNIQEARAKALQVLRERSEQKKKQKELDQMRAQLDKELLEAEQLAVQKQIEEVRRMKEAAAKPQKKKNKKALPPPDSETETSSSSEEEDVMVKRRAPTKKKSAAPVPAAPPQAAPTVSSQDALRAYHAQRIAALQQALFRGMSM
jgi:hypothetical protein